MAPLKVRLNERLKVAILVLENGQRERA